jgi:sodium/pantothenate symporter
MMVAQFKAGALVMKIAWPGSGSLSLSEDGPTASAAAAPGPANSAAPPKTASDRFWAWLIRERIYLVGLAVFSLTVVGYTLIGGFLAAVWTDLLQSVMMFFGVMILIGLAIPAVGGFEQASRKALANVEQNALSRGDTPAQATQAASRYVSGPGQKKDGSAWLPLTLAFSFFCFWPFAGTASPASVVRIMACKDTAVLRKSMFLLAIYNMGIYLPLIAICICARAMMPDLGNKSDEVIPRMALTLTQGLPFGSWMSGLILAAPFGAIMATVSSYLLVIASGLVRDVYQRFINPQATDYEIRRLTYFVMILIGIVAVGLNIVPVDKLQMLVVFSSGCAASAFLMPALMMCYWRRATAVGTIAAMLTGAGVAFSLNMVGLVNAYRTGNSFQAYNLLGFEPIVWGLIVSAVVGIVVSLLTRPPDEELVSKLFDAPTPKTA